jgi:hypothetical protein
MPENYHNQNMSPQANRCWPSPSDLPSRFFCINNNMYIFY